MEYGITRRILNQYDVTPRLDILAPGVNIISLSHLIVEANNSESILASGTSYASPHVSGAVARYLGTHPNATAVKVKNALIASARNIMAGAPGGTTTKALNLKKLISSSSDDDDDDKDDEDKDDD